MTKRSQRLDKGFTLIELLVVIGLISILAAGIGLSMRGGNPTAALRAGQGSLIALMSSARGQAALTQADAMIVIDVTNSNSDDFLRSLQVVVRTGADTWKPTGDPILLPQGIYVVPPTIANLEAAGKLKLADSWPPKRRSSGFIIKAKTLPSDPDEIVVTLDEAVSTGAFSGKQYMRFQLFNPLGTTGTSGVLLLTSGKRSSATEITLDNPEFIRGLILSKYGVPTLINETDSFDKI